MSAKRMVALILSLLLLLSLAACAAEPTSPATTTPADTAADAPAPTEPAEEPAEAPTEEPTEESVEEPIETVDPDTLPTMDENGKVHAAKKSLISYPVGDGSQTLSYWYGGFEPARTGGMENPTQTHHYPALEAATGIVVDYQICGTAAAAEQKNLMYVSQDYSDIISTNHDDYPGGVAKAVEDEVFVNLTDLIPQYAPDYKALLELVPDYDRVAKEDDGNYYMIIQLNTSVQWVCNGPLVRGDWLEALGLDHPKTYEEFHSMLTAMHETYNTDYTYMLSANGLDQGFLNGYGISNTGWQINGDQVEYSFTKDGYRKYLELISQWYAEGLIVSDFVNMNPFVNSGDIFSDRVAGVTTFFTMPNNFQVMKGDPNFLMVPTYFPTEDGSGVVHLGQTNPYAQANGQCCFHTVRKCRTGAQLAQLLLHLRRLASAKLWCGGRYLQFRRKWCSTVQRYHSKPS